MPFVPVPFAAPTYNTQQSADRVIDLMLRQGDVAAQGARAQGGIWGNAVAGLGQQAGQFLQQRDQQKQQEQHAAVLNQAIQSFDGQDIPGFFKGLVAQGIDPTTALNTTNGMVGLAKLGQKPDDPEAFRHALVGAGTMLDQPNGEQMLASNWGNLYPLLKQGAKDHGVTLQPDYQPEYAGLIKGFQANYQNTEHIDAGDRIEIRDKNTGKLINTITKGEKPGEKAPGTIDEQIAAAQLAGDAAKVKTLLATKQQIASAGRDPNVAAAASATRENARSDRSYQYNTSELERLGKPVADQVENYSKFSSAIDQKTKEGDALAAPALLKVMIGGQGSGVRITKSEIDQVLGGRAKADDLQAFLQKWSSDSGAIPDRQRAQMKALADDVYKRVANKADLISKARRDLANASDVEGHRKVMNDLQDQLGKMDTPAGPKVGDTKTTQFGKFRWDGTGWEKLP